MELAEGLYESVVTAGLRDRLSGGQLETVTEGVAEIEVPGVLAEHVARAVADALGTLTPTQRIEVVNRILGLLPAGDPVEPGPQQLLAVRRPVAPGVWRIEGRPSISLAQLALLTNARGEPSLAAEIDSSNSAIPAAEGAAVARVVDSLAVRVCRSRTRANAPQASRLPAVGPTR